MFSKHCRDVYNQVLKINDMFCFLCVGDTKHKRKKNNKKKLQKKCAEKIGGRIGFCPKNVFRETAEHYLCLKGEKSHFVCATCFGKSVLFCLLQRNQKTLLKYGFHQAHDTTKKTIFWAKRCFRKGSLKGCLIFVIHKSRALLQTLFL